MGYAERTHLLQKLVTIKAIILAAPYFSTLYWAVTLAKVGLTAVFGMGTGVPPPLEPPR